MTRRPLICAHCGLAYGVKRLAIVVDGHVELELELCAEHRRALLELAERSHV